MGTQSVYGEVYSTKEYAPAQEFGSGIHRPGGDFIEIRPRTKKALAFHMNAAEGIVIVAKVRHPGVPATHFLSKSVDVQKLVVIFTSMVVDALKKALAK